MSLNEIIGQDESIFILKNSIINNNLHSCYLISGYTGTGKTTLARIFSKCINCETGQTITPCNTCKTCTSINNCSNIDTIEFDAASKNKVESIKEIIDLSNYHSIYSKYKIFIFDEVQMLSNSSFNALLKVLEEPQKNTKYILITTDIKKIPDTIISRSLHIKLNKIPNELIHKQLINILEKENIKYDNELIRSLTYFSNGSIRYAINSLEKALLESNNNLLKLENTLGVIKQKYIYLIIILIHKKKIKTLTKIATLFENNNKDFYKIITQIQITLHELLINKFNTKKNIFIKNNKINKIILNTITTNDILKYYNMILENKYYVKYSPTLKIGFEYLIIRMSLIKEN